MTDPGTVLVTGSAGILGSRVVHRLAEHGLEVTALVRTGTIARFPDNVQVVEGDVRRRADVDPLVRAAATVVHAATSARRFRSVDVTGTQMVGYACAETSTHLVFPSMVGAEQSVLPYLASKREAEQILTRIPGLPWTIQRTTQFHSTVDNLLATRIIPLAPRTPLQPVDSSEAAARLVGLVLAGPSGRVSDFGGPEQLDVRELVEIRREVLGQAGRLLPLPAIGPFEAIADGAQLLVGGDTGHVTYREWLQTRV